MYIIIITIISYCNKHVLRNYRFLNSILVSANIKREICKRDESSLVKMECLSVTYYSEGLLARFPSLQNWRRLLYKLKYLFIYLFMPFKLEL